MAEPFLGLGWIWSSSHSSHIKDLYTMQTTATRECHKVGSIQGLEKPSPKPQTPHSKVTELKGSILAALAAVRLGALGAAARFSERGAMKGIQAQKQGIL